LERWKNGRMEEWKIGRLERWKNGMMEERKNGGNVKVLVEIPLRRENGRKIDGT